METDYEYELQSSLCNPSRNPDIQTENTSETPRAKKRAHLLLEERLDLDFGLLDNLFANGYLHEHEYIDIKNDPHSFRRNQRFLSYFYRNDGKKDEMEMKQQALTKAMTLMKQTHLINYVKNTSNYSKTFLNDWPLTDKQTMTLNRNQEILVELLELSSELLEMLYSRGIINKRQKEYIFGQPGDAKKNEAFLDILRRRSFRDYKETIKCLEATNQDNIAKVLVEGVVGRMICCLSQSEDAESETENAKQFVKKISEILTHEPESLGLVKFGLIGARFDKVVMLYLHFETPSQLNNLSTMQEEKLEDIAKKDFSCIKTLKWFDGDLNRCNKFHFYKLLNDLPMELLEMILSKAFAMYFRRDKPHPEEQDLFISLASVCQKWYTTMATRRFKISVNNCMGYYERRFNKTPIVIRNNINFLNGNLQPTPNLLKQLRAAGCLNDEEVQLIQRLQFVKDRNYELLRILRSLSFERHCAFLECLYDQNQTAVAKVLEFGGVVVKSKIKCTFVEMNEDRESQLVTVLNYFCNKAHDELQDILSRFHMEKFGMDDILHVQQESKRYNVTSMIVWIWLKSQTSLKLLEESKALKEFHDTMEEAFKFVFTYTSILSQMEAHGMISRVPRENYEELKLNSITIDDASSKQNVFRPMKAVHIGDFEVLKGTQTIAIGGNSIYGLLYQSIAIFDGEPPFRYQITKKVPNLCECPFHVSSLHYMGYCRPLECLFIACAGQATCIWKLSLSDLNCNTWKSNMNGGFCMSVSDSGNVLIVKNQPTDGCILDIYHPDGDFLQSISFPLIIDMGRVNSVTEMSPEKYVIAYSNNLYILFVDLAIPASSKVNTLNQKGFYPRSIHNWTVYSHSRLFFIEQINRMITGIRLFDSDFNITGYLDTTDLNCCNVNARQLMYQKDKRRLFVPDSTRLLIRIYTITNEGQDWIYDSIYRT